MLKTLNFKVETELLILKKKKMVFTLETNAFLLCHTGYGK